MASKITLYDESGAPHYLDGDLLKILLTPQTWQNVALSRALGTEYVNNTDKPIQMAISFYTTSASSKGKFYIDGNLVLTARNDNSGGVWAHVQMFVPVGSSYKLELTGAYGLTHWFELR